MPLKNTLSHNLTDQHRLERLAGEEKKAPLNI